MGKNKPKVIIFASGTKYGGGVRVAKFMESLKTGVLKADIVGVASDHISGGVKKNCRDF